MNSEAFTPKALLGGSWVVISGVISPLIWVLIMVTPLVTTHEPPSLEPPIPDKNSLEGLSGLL